MFLDAQDLNLFFKLHRSLMNFVNQRLNVVPGDFETRPQVAAMTNETRHKIRSVLLANLDIIDLFVSENPGNLPADELDIVRSWRHLVHGEFFVVRDLKNYTIFLLTKAPLTVYGVVQLSQTIQELAGRDLPIAIEGTLLPFKGRIVFEGLPIISGFVFGPNHKRTFNDAYTFAKGTNAIITSLPRSLQTTATEVATKPKRPASAKKKVASPKAQSDDKLATILFMVESFCKLRLNDEYAALCCKLAEKLGRKRPSPFVNGNANTWASGIVRAIGWVNFLGDPSQEPYMRMSDIDAGFGVSESAGSAKLSAIKKLVNLSPLSVEWTVPSLMDANPMVWNLKVNGFIIDIRHAPREFQEEAFKQGLIPYIPADRE